MDWINKHISIEYNLIKIVKFSVVSGKHIKVGNSKFLLNVQNNSYELF